jgi:hypothetical protein
MGSFDYGHWTNPCSACFVCRKSFKYENKRCPHCGSETHVLGTHFKPPKRDRLEQWKVIETLYWAGIRFDVDDPGWSNLYERYSTFGGGWDEFNLEQVMLAYGITDSDASKWQDLWCRHHFQCPGQRPTKLRDVPRYLEWSRQQNLRRIAVIFEVCDRLNRLRPPLPEGYTLDEVQALLPIISITPSIAK